MKIEKLKKRVIEDYREAVNIEEIERLAISKLNLNALSYFISGANNEFSLRRNKDTFHKILLYPKVLKDVSQVDLRINVLEHSVDMPIMISPSATHKLCHPEGELATAQAAKEESTLLTLSTLSSVSMKDVAEANGDGARWFQLYVTKDREETLALVKNAELNNYSALVLTVDAPILGHREKDAQINFKLPEGVQYENLIWARGNVAKCPQMENEKISNSEIFKFFQNNIDPSLTWEVIPWLKKVSKLKIILKGVHRVDDALKAQQLGVDAIIVSNHGGRQLDGVPSTVEMLYAIRKVIKKVPGAMEIYIDGGIRRGSDIFKALALGANSVMIGRPILWGLAAAGKDGIKRVIKILRDELTLAMKLSGCSSVNDINEDYVRVKENFAKF